MPRRRREKNTHIERTNGRASERESSCYTHLRSLKWIYNLENEQVPSHMHPFHTNSHSCADRHATYSVQQTSDQPTGGRMQPLIRIGTYSVTVDVISQLGVEFSVFILCERVLSE